MTNEGPKEKARSVVNPRRAEHGSVSSWQEETVRALDALLRPDEGVLAVALSGSCAREPDYEARGSVTRAAKLLGLTHQTLGTILNERHKRLSKKRTPVKRRLRSIIKELKG